jgi:TRAP-type mannitol/chloroaromatic compound transport system substrate-binding protein
MAKRMLAWGAACLVIGGLAAGAADGQERARWKMASSYASTLDVIGPTGLRLSENIGKLSNGSFELKFFEPNALVPPLQVFDPVSQGSIEAAWTAAGFHAGKISALPFFSSVPFGPQVGEYLAWMHFGGGQQLYDEIYAPHNLKGYQAAVVIAEASGWFRKEIKSVDDLRGLKMRFFGLGAKVMEKFGVSTQLLAPGDIYPALELGTLDATELSFPSMDVKMGFHQVAKHYYFPGWHQQASLIELLVSKPKFDALSKQHQAMLEIGAREGLWWSMALGESKQSAALREVKSKGVTVHMWPDSFLKQLEAKWEEVLREESARDATFKKVADNYLAFRKDFAEWRAVAYLK